MSALPASFNVGVEFAYYLTPDGEQYALGGGSRHTLGWRGLGHLEAEYVTDRGPFQDGVTVRYYKYPPRIIEYDLFLGGRCRDDFWNYYATLADTVRPNRASTPGRLLFITSNGYEREIFTWIQSGPLVEWDGRGSQQPQNQQQLLRWFCPDPIFREPTENSISVTVNPYSSLIFPFTFPLTFGEGVINDEHSITYGGNYRSYPVIVFTGPLASPSVTNETTGETIALGYSIAAGEAVTVDLDYNNQGIKRVTNNYGVDLIGTVLNPNDLATFHLEVDPVAPGGVNVLHFSGVLAVEGLSSISISYYDRFMGVPR